MDSWDKQLTYAQSLLLIVRTSETPTSSKKASNIRQEKCREFVTKVNELMEELKLAKWPVSEVERRWKDVEPLLQEADRLSVPTSLPMQLPRTETPKKKAESLPISSSHPANRAYDSNDSTRSRLNQQYELMEAQDASLWTLSDKVDRLKGLGSAMSEESNRQTRIIDDITKQVEDMSKKTEKSTEKVKKL